MNKDSQPTDNQGSINQPMTPEEVDPKQKQDQKAVLENCNPTVNPGDRIDESKSLEQYFGHFFERFQKAYRLYGFRIELFFQSQV